jgi:hypothetical protein
VACARLGQFAVLDLPDFAGIMEYRGREVKEEV